MVMVDEAHATGVVGARGAGLVEALGLERRVDRADGHARQGARRLRRLRRRQQRADRLPDQPRPHLRLHHRAAAAGRRRRRPPRSTIVEREPERRAPCAGNAHACAPACARSATTCAATPTSHILPVIIGDAEPTMALSDALLDHGVFAHGIRPPTVPDGTARIRATVMATHTRRGHRRGARRLRAPSREGPCCSASATGAAMSRGPIHATSSTNSTASSRLGPRSYLWHPFTQMRDWLAEPPLIIERGEGNYLIDTEGRRYLDGVSSLWCNVHGHRKRELDEALKAQCDRIAHSTMLGLANVPATVLAKRLVELDAGVADARLLFRCRRHRGRDRAQARAAVLAAARRAAAHALRRAHRGLSRRHARRRRASATARPSTASSARCSRRRSTSIRRTSSAGSAASRRSARCALAIDRRRARLRRARRRDRGADRRAAHAGRRRDVVAAAGYLPRTARRWPRATARC